MPGWLYNKYKYKYKYRRAKRVKMVVQQNRGRQPAAEAATAMIRATAIFTQPAPELFFAQPAPELFPFAYFFAPELFPFCLIFCSTCPQAIPVCLFFFPRHELYAVFGNLEIFMHYFHPTCPGCSSCYY